MKKILLLITITVLFFNCNNNKTKTPSNAETPTNEEEQEELADEIQDIIISNFDGFTVGNGIRLRESANTKSKKIAELPNGMLLNFLEQTRRKSITTGTDCDEYGYPWIKVKTAGGTEGWIFGKFVYRFEGGEDYKEVKKHHGKTFKFDEERYQFGIGFDFSYTPMDDEGLTGCENTAIPFFHQEGIDRVQTIITKKTDGRDWELAANKNGYWTLMAGAGYIESLSDVVQILWGVRVNYFAEYQEGTAEGQIDIKRQNNKFYASYIKYNSKYE